MLRKQLKYLRNKKYSEGGSDGEMLEVAIFVHHHHDIVEQETAIFLTLHYPSSIY